jgi:flagellar hook-basal body complex protein FliE
MFNTKTYFEQIPLEFVRKIVEEQIQTEAASEAFQGIDEEKLSDVFLEAEKQSIVQPPASAQVEPLN